MATDVPVVGDWDGDGKDDLGVFRNGIWYLDLKQAKANSVLSQIEQGGVARTLGIAALGR